MLRWVLLAYPDRVARRRGPGATGVMVGGRGVRLTPDVGRPRLRVLPRPRPPRGSPGRRCSRSACGSPAPSRPEWLEELFPEAIRRERAVRFDAEPRRVVGVNTLWYRDLALREDRNAAVNPDEASRPPGRGAAPPRARPCPGRRGRLGRGWLAWPSCHRAMPEVELARVRPRGPRRLDAGWSAPANARSEEVSRSTRPAGPPAAGTAHPTPRPGSSTSRPPMTLTVPSGSRIRLRLPARPAPRPGRPAPGTLRLDRHAPRRRGPCRRGPASARVRTTAPSRSPTTCGASGRPPTSRSARTCAPATRSTPGPTTR